MAVEDIVLKFSLELEEAKKDITNLEKMFKAVEVASAKSGEIAGEAFAKGIGDGLKDVKQEFAKVGAESKQVFATGSIDQAVSSMGAYVQTIDELIVRYGSAKKANMEMLKALDLLKASGQENTKAFKQLSAQAAQLKDQMGDTRNAIKRASSDTKVFDNVMQGARGAAAAFSVFEGAAAALGDENKDLQKSLLKVQGAMAALQGVQELATLATEEGGIATKAYGFALQVVEKIQTTFAISSAAAWAAATAGISLVIGAVAYLISTYESAEDAAEKNKEKEAKLREEREKTIGIEIAGWKNVSTETDNAYKKRILLAGTAEQVINIEIEQLQQREKLQQANLEGIQKAQLATANSIKTAAEYEHITEMVNEAESKVLDTREKLRAKEEELKKIQEARFSAEMKGQIQSLKDLDALIVRFTAFEAIVNKIKADAESDNAEPFITDEQVAATDKNVEKLLGLFRKLETDSAKTAEATTEQKVAMMSVLLEGAARTAQAISNLTNQFFQNDLDALGRKRDEDLKKAGDDAKKREKIDREYARAKAKLEREQAIANKITATFQAILNTALAVTNALTTGDPYTAVARAAIAGALGAVEIATIAATPLPEIPKFEEGGFVARALKGGQIRPDGFIEGKSHRHGGVLIEAEGKEFITNKTATSKYFDELKAANSLQLEEHINRKYVSPAVERARAESSLYEYDDEGLRADVRNGVRATQKAAKYIVDGVGDKLAQQSYYARKFS